MDWITPASASAKSVRPKNGKTNGDTIQLYSGHGPLFLSFHPTQEAGGGFLPAIYSCPCFLNLFEKKQPTARDEEDDAILVCTVTWKL
jgi:hypothetical protein